jgi:hypothetical protein
MRLSPEGESPPDADLRPFFIAPIPDRTPPVSYALESVAGKKRHLAETPPYRSEPVSEGLR